MRKLFTVFLCCLVLCGNTSIAQNRKCGAQELKEALIAKDPAFAQKLLQIEAMQKQQAENYKQEQSLRKFAKTTNVGTIPVIFHIVLDSQQINLLGSNSGILERVDSEIAVINRDFNRRNADSGLIPSVFKPLYANAGIHFGAAHRTPNGNNCDGYEIIYTSANGFSDPTYAYHTAKHASSGGADAWDVSSYLNVWIINPLGASGLLGLTLPKSYVTTYPDDEGIVINLGAFGVKTNSSQYYLGQNTGGRTLTHELGHFFEIWHPWGDDNGLCPWNGGHDDGIADTPPEADATYGCPLFPHYDACDTTNATGNGVMFMNFMDYADDGCMLMFTTDQVAQMVPNVLSGGESYSLTTHPTLLNYATAVSQVEKENPFNILPNPSTGIVHVSFNDVPASLESIIVVNMLGQTVQNINTYQQAGRSYSFDLSAMSKGIYFIKCNFAEGIITRKILLQ